MLQIVITVATVRTIAVVRYGLRRLFLRWGYCKWAKPFNTQRNGLAIQNLQCTSDANKLDSSSAAIHRLKRPVRGKCNGCDVGITNLIWYQCSTTALHTWCLMVPKKRKPQQAHRVLHHINIKYQVAFFGKPVYFWRTGVRQPLYSYPKSTIVWFCFSDFIRYKPQGCTFVLFVRVRGWVAVIELLKRVQRLRIN